MEDENTQEKNEYVTPHPEDGSCIYCKYLLTHKVGYGVLHTGRYIHGSNTLINGERNNLIIWCRQ